MKLKRLVLKNIRSYESQEIIFPEGNLLLSGDIGTGKTSILLAIEYALFGLQPGQKGSSLLRNNADAGEVTLELEVDGKDIIIERKLRRSNKAINNEYAAIIMDGEKLELSITELKTKILTILAYPSEFIKRNNLLYRYTVYTPQEQMKQIILEDSETRLTVLRHIFGIDKYKTIRENLTILLNSIKEDTKVLQIEIKDLDENKNKLHSVKQFLVTLESNVLEKEKDIQDKVHRRKEVEEEAKALESKIKEKENFEKEVEKTKILISSKRENLANMQREASDINHIMGESKEIFNQELYTKLTDNLKESNDKIEKLNLRYIETVSQINALQQRQKENASKKERVFRIEMCPTCLQNVSENHKHNILNETEREMVDLQKKKEGLEIERSALSSNLSKEKDNRSNLEQQKTTLEIAKSKVNYLNSLRTRLEDLQKNKTSLESDLNLLNNHIESLKEEILNFSKFNNMYKLKQEELKKAFVEEKNSEISAAEYRKELQMTKKEIAEMELEIAEKEQSKKKLQKLSETNDWLSNYFMNLVEFTERNVLLKLRLEFSKLFNKWFHMLAGESFEVQLDETFTPLIMQGEIEMEYSFLSGGERTAVALAYRLALNQTVNSILSQIKTRDIIILDEPTEGFSDVQLDKMREVLQELNLSQLIIVSHEPKMETFVDNVLRVRKESDSSLVLTPG